MSTHQLLTGQNAESCNPRVQERPGPVDDPGEAKSTKENASQDDARQGKTENNRTLLKLTQIKTETHTSYLSVVR